MDNNSNNASYTGIIYAEYFLMWVAVFIMWMGSTHNVFSPNQIFKTKEMCEDFRKIQHITLERTKPHEQSGVKGSACVLVIKGESV